MSVTMSCCHHTNTQNAMGPQTWQWFVFHYPAAGCRFLPPASSSFHPPFSTTHATSLLPFSFSARQKCKIHPKLQNQIETRWMKPERMGRGMEWMRKRWKVWQKPCFLFSILFSILPSNFQPKPLNKETIKMNLWGRDGEGFRKEG